MSGSHGRVYAALAEMAIVNKLSETQQTNEVIGRSLVALKELTDAAEEWYEAADR